MAVSTPHERRPKRRLSRWRHPGAHESTARGACERQRQCRVPLLQPRTCRVPPLQPRTFDTPGDVEKAVGIQAADITCVQPAVGINALARLVLLVQVAHEDATAPQADLAGAVCVLVHQLHLAARH